MKLRNDYKEVITKGKFISLSSDNDNIFAFQRKLNKTSIVIFINRNLANSENVKVNIKSINKKSQIKFIKNINNRTLINSTFKGDMKPGEIIIFTINN